MPLEKYFVRDSGRITGPFDRARIAALRDAGKINERSELSADKRVWTAAEAVPWLYAHEKPVFVGEAEAGCPDSGGGDPGLIPIGIRPKISAPPRLNTVMPAEPPPSGPPPVADGEPAGGPVRLGGLAPAQGWAGLIDTAGAALSILWSPAEGLVRLRERAGEKGSAGAAVMLLVIFSLAAALLALRKNALASGQILPAAGAALAAALLWLFLFLCCLLARTLWGSGAGGGAGGDMLTAVCPLMFLITAVALLLAAERLALAGRLNPDGPLRAGICVFVSVWAVSSSVIALYEGLTELGGVRKSGAGLIVPGVFTAAAAMLFYAMKMMAVK